jgi:hypothetical protein
MAQQMPKVTNHKGFLRRAESKQSRIRDLKYGKADDSFFIAPGTVNRREKNYRLYPNLKGGKETLYLSYYRGDYVSTFETD